MEQEPLTLLEITTGLWSRYLLPFWRSPPVVEQEHLTLLELNTGLWSRNLLPFWRSQSVCGAGTSYPSGDHHRLWSRNLLPFWSSPPVFSGVFVARSLLFSVVLCRSLYFCSFSFGHCIVYPSEIYGFWLPLWYLRFTASDYHFGILDLRLLITTFLSLRFMASDYHFGILDLRLLITTFVS